LPSEGTADFSFLADWSLITLVEHDTTGTIFVSSAPSALTATQSLSAGGRSASLRESVRAEVAQPAQGDAREAWNRS